VRKSTRWKGSKEPAKANPQPSLRPKLNKCFFFLWLHKPEEVLDEIGKPH